MSIIRKYFWPIIAITSMLSAVFILRSYFKAIIKRPSDPVARDFVSPGKNCIPRVDKNGWKFIDGEIQTFPRCLSVTNSRLGSRINFDYMNGGSAFYSSVLGSLEDRDTGFLLMIDDEPLIPNAANTTYYQTTSTIGLTYQEITYESEKAVFKLKITSPFSPSKTHDDVNTLMSHAPFLYIDYSYLNKTSTTAQPQIKILWQNYKDTQDIDEHTTAYFEDPTRKDGILSVSSNKTNNLKFFKQGNKGGFLWTPSVEPGNSTSFPSVYAGYVSGTVITDNSNGQVHKPLVFAYTNWFSSIDDVNQYAHEHRNEFIQKTQNFETTTKNQFNTPQEYWIASQAFHSYLGNTWLVKDRGNTDDIYYLVWEGEFKYINTVDVAHEYAVLEGKFFPWVLKSTIDLWHQSAKKDEFGLVIPHDIGIRHDVLLRQTYGTADMYPSAMPVEENTNYLLLLYWYYYQTNDIEFIKQQSSFIVDIFSSLKARDTNNDGIANVVGTTTYDNDGNKAMLKAPENTYLAIKQLSSYLFLSELLKQIDKKEIAQEVENEAIKIKQTIVTYYKMHQNLPLTLDKDFNESNEVENNSSPMIMMGLLYPSLTKFESSILDELKPILSSLYPTFRQDASIYDSDNILVGHKLAKNQKHNLGWISHLLGSDYVAKQMLELEYEPPEYIFKNLYDNPYAYTDGFIINPEDFSWQSLLVFYPRGAVIFAKINDY